MPEFAAAKFGAGNGAFVPRLFAFVFVFGVPIELPLGGRGRDEDMALFDGVPVEEPAGLGAGNLLFAIGHGAGATLLLFGAGKLPAEGAEVFIPFPPGGGNFDAMGPEVDGDDCDLTELLMDEGAEGDGAPGGQNLAARLELGA